MPFFFFEVAVFGCGVIVEPLFDSNPAAVIGIVAADGIRGLISRLAFIFSDVFSFGAVLLPQNLPGCWLFE